MLDRKLQAQPSRSTGKRFEGVQFEACILQGITLISIGNQEFVGSMSSVAEVSLSTRDSFEHQHEQSVRAEIERFRTKAEQVLAGVITDDEFRAFRLRYGIY